MEMEIFLRRRETGLLLRGTEGRRERNDVETFLQKEVSNRPANSHVSSHWADTSSNITCTVFIWMICVYIYKIIFIRSEMYGY